MTTDNTSLLRLKFFQPREQMRLAHPSTRLISGIGISPVLASGFSSSGSNEAEQAHFTAEQTIKFSKKVEMTLANKGARVAILARMGRPRAELPEGMHFTHVAFAL